MWQRKRIKGIDYVNNMHKMLLSRVVAHASAHAYLLHSIGACGLTSKKLITEFARRLSLARLVKARISDIQNLLPL